MEITSTYLYKDLGDLQVNILHDVNIKNCYNWLENGEVSCKLLVITSLLGKQSLEYWIKG